MSWWSPLTAELKSPAVVLAGTALALVVLVHFVVNWWVRRRSRHPGGAEASPWLPRGLVAIAAPMELLVWVHGLYAALRLLLPRFAPEDMVDPAQTALAWAYRVGVVTAICWLLSRVGRLVEQYLVSLAARTDIAWDDLVLPLAGAAARRGLPLVALILAAPTFSPSPALAEIIGNATSLLLVGLVAYVLYQAVEASAAFVLKQHRLDVGDNLQARAIYTQVTVLRKIAVTAIAIFALASMLMVFEPVRQFGASILASAGIAGIVVGFAAQRSIATMLAGFQIALTQPIRVDDVVIVEGEWGRVEDITLTYVVVRIWDLRRLVVPITYFIERPFQNWTRTSAEILGTVFLYVDYTMPLDALRAELTRVLESSPRWDGKVNVLQVTDAREHTLEVRALTSAADASLAWELRCEVREKLIAFVQRQYPDCLPRLRASLDARSGAEAAGVVGLAQRGA